MAQTFKDRISARCSFNGTYGNGSIFSDPALYWDQSWSNGTTTGKANTYFESDLQASAVPNTYDLFTGTSTMDAFNLDLDMTRVVYFGIKNETRTPGAGIVLTGDFITTILMATVTSITVPPGGVHEWASAIGKTITLAGNNISIVRQTVNADYQMIVIGSK